MRLRIILVLALVLSLGLMLVSCGDKPCTEHIDENIDGKCDVCGETVTPEPEPCTEHEDTDGDERCDRCGERVEPKDDGETAENPIKVTKTSSRDADRTVHPGDEIIYTLTLENATENEESITLVDTLSDKVMYVDGDGTLDGNSLTLSATVPGGSHVSLSYKVKLKGDASGLGGRIVSLTKLSGKSVSSNTLYIEKTFNGADREKFSRAIWAMLDSDNEKIEDKRLLGFLYTIAFSASAPVSDTADNIISAIFINTGSTNTKKYTDLVAPGLWGGKACESVDAKRFKAAKYENVTLQNFLPGDVLCVLKDKTDFSTARMYVTDSTYVYDITKRCVRMPDASVITSLSENDYFAILRPSMGFTMDSVFRSGDIYEGESDVERAIIATAEAYLIRGDRVQYADTRLVRSPAIYRWERGKAPEDYTADETGYTNCTGFVHDVYLNALGFDYGSFTLVNSPVKMKAYVQALTGTENSAQRAEIEGAYRSELKVGDIIFYTYASGANTHAMLYVGNGNVIHCTGGIYAEKEANTEIEEPAIRYFNLDSLFDPSNSRYVFSSEKPRDALYIIRPMNIWSETDLSETSEQRISEMRGIFAEKRASATLGMTVNVGDTITYTFTVFNSNRKARTVTVTDKIPVGTTLIEGGAASDKTDISFTLELMAGEKKTVSYTVRVSDGTSNGTAILSSSESKVGGIPTLAPPIYVGNTLTEDEANRLVAYLESKNLTAGESSDAISLVNEAYEELFGVENILGDSLGSLKESLFTASSENFVLNGTGDIALTVAPSLYGGKSVLNSDRFSGERTRMPREKNLVVGDVLYLQSSENGYLYMYVGDGKFYDLNKSLNPRDAYERLEETIGWTAFAVLRPSLVID